MKSSAMNFQASVDAKKHICTVCSAPAAVWCHHDAASLCSWCDAEVHSKGPLAWTHKRTPLNCCELHGGSAIAEGNECQRGSSSGHSSGQVCANQSFALPEAGSAEDQLFDDGLHDLNWIPPAIDTAELNVLAMDSDFDFLDDPFVQPGQTGALKPPSSFAGSDVCKDAASLLMGATDTTPGKATPELLACPTPTTDSDHMDDIVWPAPPSPPPRALSAQQPQAQSLQPAASRDTSTSGATLVPTRSCQSFDQLSQPAAAYPVPASSAGTHTTAPSTGIPQATCSNTSPGMAMPMPMQVPMQPFMQWPFMDMFMPMCQPWANYIPASLMPKGDAAAQHELLTVRRAKRDRFQRKKRELSCRKTVRYASRKRYADSRPRVNGRFISKAATAAAAAAATAVSVSDESA
eukprot:jgi/Ulvmu1/6378/UM003_0006.1